MKTFFKFLFACCVLIGVPIALATGFTGAYFYFRLTRDLPRIDALSDYRPKAVSYIYAEDGTLMAEVFQEGHRRYPVKMEEVPPLVKNAFLAAEDASFYSHPGIDFVSILRAVYVNFTTGKSKQGASTITQQVVKSLLLTREKTYDRKAKEAILSYRLEHRLTKDDIFSIYLNEIFLGQTAYGIKAASKIHFHKELRDLSVAQAAFLATLPQRPSELIEPRNRGEAITRQHYVLDQMRKHGMITEAQRQEALKEKIVIFPPDSNTTYHAPYFVSHAIQVADEELKKIDRRYSLKNPGGFSIHTTCDLRADDLARRSLQQALREVDKRRGWRGVLSAKGSDADIFLEESRRLKEGLRSDEVYHAKVMKVVKPGVLQVRVGEFEGTLDLASAGWAKRFLMKGDEVVGGDPAKAISVGDVVEVSLAPPPKKKPEEGQKEKETEPYGEAVGLYPLRVMTDPTEELVFQLDQSPEVEGAFAVQNVNTGAVKAVIGGYDHRRSVFNRATQGLLQPGSSFKPFIYVAALDTLKYTPSTLVPDEPISLVAGDGKLWSPSNFDHKFLGPITLRTALQRSRNVVSVFLLKRMGIERGIESARQLGISTPIDKNMSIALGTSEVKLLEMVRAYGAFSAGGYLADSLSVRSITDRSQTEIYHQDPKQHRVLNEDTAFIMANMMKGVVERGTATVIKKLERPAAGKTGTTNNHMDAWFIGYTPDLAAGAWVGFDVKRSLGKIETGGKAAAPVFLYFMKEYLKGTPVLDFDIPDGVIPVAVDLNSGRPSGGEGAFIEYFKADQAPEDAGGYPDVADSGESAPTAKGPSAQDYLSSDEF